MYDAGSPDDTTRTARLTPGAARRPVTPTWGGLAAAGLLAAAPLLLAAAATAPVTTALALTAVTGAALTLGETGAPPDTG